MTNTFKIVALIFSIGMFPLNSNAQNKQEKIRYAIEKATEEYKDIVRQNMNFTIAETNSFWPLLNQYLVQKEEIFAKEVNLFLTDSQKLTDKGAANFIKRMQQSEKDLSRLKNKYFKRIQKKLPAKKFLRFLQIDHYIEVARDFKLSSQIPLVKA